MRLPLRWIHLSISWVQLAAALREEPAVWPAEYFIPHVASVVLGALWGRKIWMTFHGSPEKSISVVPRDFVASSKQYWSLFILLPNFSYAVMLPKEWSPILYWGNEAKYGIGFRPQKMLKNNQSRDWNGRDISAPIKFNLRHILKIQSVNTLPKKPTYI